MSCFAITDISADCHTVFAMIFASSKSAMIVPNKHINNTELVEGFVSSMAKKQFLQILAVMRKIGMEGELLGVRSVC